MRKQTKVWTTRDGRKIRICDMTDEHLLNTIRLLRRAKEKVVSEGYKTLCFLRGEQAVFDLECELYQLEVGDIDVFHPLGEVLLQEAHRRGLRV